jgi:hypothetical protein
MIDLSTLMVLVLHGLIIGGVCWLLIWLIDYCATPMPFNKILKIIVVVVGVFMLINLLLGIGGGTHQIVRW